MSQLMSEVVEAARCGKITGTSQINRPLEGKRIELLKDLEPGLIIVVYLSNGIVAGRRYGRARARIRRQAGLEHDRTHPRTDNSALRSTAGDGVDHVKRRTSDAFRGLRSRGWVEGDNPGH